MSSLDLSHTMTPPIGRTAALSNRMLPGRLIFACGIAGLGLQQLLLGTFAAELLPVATTPQSNVLARLTGLVLLAIGAGIGANWKPHLCALALTLLCVAGIASTQVPLLITTPRDVGAWVSAFELVSVAGVALCLAVIWAPLRPAWTAAASAAATVGVVSFGVASVVFGTVHFMYAEAIASLIPHWIPGALAWAYLVGAARVAAGVAVVIGRWRWWAGILLSAMYGAWVLIVHAPRLIATSGSSREWAFMLLAIAFCGGAWLIAAVRPAPSMKVRRP